MHSLELLQKIILDYYSAVWVIAFDYMHITCFVPKTNTKGFTSACSTECDNVVWCSGRLSWHNCQLSSAR